MPYKNKKDKSLNNKAWRAANPGYNKRWLATRSTTRTSAKQLRLERKKLDMSKLLSQGYSVEEAALKVGLKLKKKNDNQRKV